MSTVAATMTTLMATPTMASTAAAAAPASNSDAITGSARIAGGAAIFYRDLLLTIFPFLDLSSFVCTCMVHTSWYEVGLRMKSRQEEWQRRITIQVSHLVLSPIASHHIKGLRLGKVDANELSLVRHHMTHLTSLQLTLEPIPSDLLLLHSSTHVFCPLPPRLQELSMTVDFWRLSYGESKESQRVQYLNRCLNELADQATCLYSLELVVNGLNLDDIIMDCPTEVFKRIPSLTKIELPADFDIDQQIELIKSLPSIRHFTLPLFGLPVTDFIQQLVDGPSGPPPCLEVINAPLEEVDEEMANKLQRIVTLTQLDITLSLSDPTTFFSQFPQLSNLKLDCCETVDVNLLVAGLSTCINLVAFEVSAARLTSDHLSCIVPHLSSLTELNLFHCQGVVSLNFLTISRSSFRNLRLFKIRYSTQIPLAEYYTHLQSIAKSLEYLTIERSCLDRWTDEMIAAWTPNSKQFRLKEWPRLKQFTLIQWFETARKHLQLANRS